MASPGSRDLREQHLVSPEWLQDHLTDPAARIVDMRGAVRTETEPDGTQRAVYEGGRAAYEVGHIPGAVFLDWTRDIVDENDPVPAQVAPREKIARVLSQAGIGDEHLVVAYDDHPAAQFATRLWWVLRYYGHQAVRVLDGGWAAWQRAGGPVSTDLPSHSPATFTPRPAPGLRATAEEVVGLIGAPDALLVDARDEGQYTGRIRRGLRGGHIPGAVHLAREELIDPATGSFRSTAELHQRVEEAGLSPDRRIVAYCNGGVAATSVLFALSMLGYEDLTNYDGSWNEWGNRGDLPVEKEMGK